MPDKSSVNTKANEMRAMSTRMALIQWTAADPNLPRLGPKKEWYAGASGDALTLNGVTVVVAVLAVPTITFFAAVKAPDRAAWAAAWTSPPAAVAACWTLSPVAAASAFAVFTNSPLVNMVSVSLTTVAPPCSTPWTAESVWFSVSATAWFQSFQPQRRRGNPSRSCACGERTGALKRRACKVSKRSPSRVWAGVDCWIGRSCAARPGATCQTVNSWSWSPSGWPSDRKAC
mmetsp:Transcript_96213/g.294287  ORF Transcript_96213/g.294287 Transcript_96213/m.294287 type:complete len:231 (-) Transcript_96213:470-1162(-)